MAKKILFVYDEEDEILGELALELNLQYDIMEAHDVKTAIKLLKEIRILTLVIADCSPPKFLGSSMLEALKTDSIIIGIPFIAVSCSLEQKDRLIKAGADTFYWRIDNRKIFLIKSANLFDRRMKRRIL